MDPRFKKVKFSTSLRRAIRELDAAANAIDAAAVHLAQCKDLRTMLKRRARSIARLRDTFQSCFDNPPKS